MNSQEIVTKLTLEEKASLCSGLNFWNLKSIERLGIGSIMVTDGPHGLRKQVADSDQLGVFESVPATCFPPACATASSFDTALMREIGLALGEECQQENVGVLLGPGANIKRSPLCGRNFEYISEDPHLTGKIAAALINGIQENGVGTSLKHYAANSQEKARMTGDSVVDERALREIYLTGFETAVKESQPWTVMCSYNKLNGTYASENEWLLTKVLRDEWGFEGAVVTDWGATNDRVLGVKAGLDLEMPGNHGVNDAKIVDAVKAGTLSEVDLDKIVVRIVDLILKAQTGQRNNYTYDAKTHHALGRRAAAESSVLLKNKDNILPLTDGKSVAVIGGFGKNPRYQGAGSSKINPLKVDNAFDTLATLGVDVSFAEGYAPSGKPDETLLANAVTLAKEKDIALVFVGLPDEYESEGFDRSTLDMPKGHVSLVEAVAAANPNTVVILQLGAPIVMPWADQVKGILVSYLGGQAAGSGCADVLTGKVVPGGKLAESWPLALEDTPCYAYYPGTGRTAEYRESLFVGYRYYDTMQKPVAYPFGYGLSYTSFEYSNLKVTQTADTPQVKVSFVVTNTGNLAGAEVAQLYVGLPSSVLMRAKHELKGFCKVFLKPGEQREITLTLNERDFSYYNVPAASWAVEGGEYLLEVGASSRDIHLSESITVGGDGRETLLAELKDRASTYFTHNHSDIQTVSDLTFEALLGRKLPPKHRQPGEKYDQNTSLGEIQHTMVGKQIIKQIKAKMAETFGNNEDLGLMFNSMIMDMPLRALVMMGGESFSTKKMNGLLDILNGRPIRGYRALLSKK